MDVREKLVELQDESDICPEGITSCIGCKYHKEYAFGKPCDVMAAIADKMIAHGVTVQEWVSVKDKLPENDGQYLIFTTQYFTPDHIDEIDHIYGIEISGYSKRFGFLSKNGLHAKYWRDIPQPPKGE